MNKISKVIVFLGSMCCFLIANPIAMAEDAESTIAQLTSELQQAGTITQSEAEAIQASLENMVEKGANKKELKSVVSELSNNGVKGNDLKQLVNSMNDLVNKGEKPKDAGSIVSKTVKQAHEQGLKGRDLAAKVHEAIKQRKAEREAKKEAEKAQKEAKKEAKKAEKELKQKRTVKELKQMKTVKELKHRTRS